jgi:hypothetical protein
VLIELGCQRRDLREYNDTKQEQNEDTPPPETRSSCH